MSKTMAEVLREHWTASTHSDSKPFVDKCDGCGEVIFSWSDPTVGDGHERLAAHQSAALSAAGFGLVTDAKAEALEEAADKVMGPSVYLADRATCHNIANDLRARAAALLGDS